MVFCYRSRPMTRMSPIFVCHLIREARRAKCLSPYVFAIFSVHRRGPMSFLISTNGAFSLELKFSHDCGRAGSRAVANPGKTGRQNGVKGPIRSWHSLNAAQR